MKAIILKAPGTVENLLLKEIPLPVLGTDEVLIKNKSISINPVDIKTRNGNGVYNYGDVNKAAQLILGWDVSGVIIESKSAGFKPGDEVFGMINFPGIGNAYAEYVAAPAIHLALKPANISHDEAAAATLAALTAWQALITNAGIKAGDRVLIHAASGGVGHYAIQIAKHQGAYVIGTSSAVNKEFVLSFGADEHIDYKSTKFTDIVKNVDFVLDMLGKENINDSLDVIKPGGQLISIVSQFDDTLNKKAAAKNINGRFMLVTSNGKDMKIIADLLAAGKLKSHVSETFPFEKMADAHLQIEGGRTIGKIIVNV